MHQDVVGLPACFQVREAARDTLVGGDIHLEGDIRAQLLCEREHAIGHSLDVRERQLRALAVHGPGDAPGDGTIRREPHDQGALAV